MAPGILNTIIPHLWQFLRYWWNAVNFLSTKITFDRVYLTKLTPLCSSFFLSSHWHHLYLHRELLLTSKFDEHLLVLKLVLNDHNLGRQKLVITQVFPWTQRAFNTGSTRQSGMYWKLCVLARGLSWKISLRGHPRSRLLETCLTVCHLRKLQAT